MHPYPRLWRQLVLALSDAGTGTKKVAEQLGCSEAWVRRVKQEHRDLCKRGPYVTRCRDRHSCSIPERITRLIIEDPGIEVEDLQRVCGQVLDTRMLAGIKTQLYMLDNIHWHGAEGALPRDWITEEVEKSAATGRITYAKWILKNHIKDLLTWRPETTADEVQIACGQELSVAFLCSIRNELSFFGVCWLGANASPLLATVSARDA